MTRLEPSETIEATVGARRSPNEHIGRAVSAEQRIYILHSAECVATGVDLRECPYSKALDAFGIDMSVWEGREDEPVILKISDLLGDIVPHGDAA
jgi:hypothetical protein